MWPGPILHEAIALAGLHSLRRISFSSSAQSAWLATCGSHVCVFADWKIKAASTDDMIYSLQNQQERRKQKDTSSDRFPLKPTRENTNMMRQMAAHRAVPRCPVWRTHGVYRVTAFFRTLGYWGPGLGAAKRLRFVHGTYPSPILQKKRQ